MSKIRLFWEKSLEEKSQVKVSDKDFHYLSNVMRCDIGSTILLFNKVNGEFLSKVIKKTKNEFILSVINRIKHEQIKNVFNMAFCPPKSKKLDFLIQKCTEIGVNNFYPIISDHTENRNLNLGRIKKIIKEAVEQSNQTHIPEIYNPIIFSNFVKKSDGYSQIFFGDIQSDKKLANLKIDMVKEKFIFIGPEGDFSLKEIEIIRSNQNFFSFSLGKRIFRSETAAIASLVLFNNFFN
tara:strand:- start:87 stop:797 length:711 start_codon:yes stop_codon:yes gene_type:complete